MSTIILDLCSNIWAKINGFCHFLKKPSTLAHILLHKSNINVAILDNFSQKQCLYNLQEQKYRNSGKKGVAPDMVTTFQRGRPIFLIAWTFMNIFDWSDRLKLHKSTGFVSAPGLNVEISDLKLLRVVSTTRPRNIYMTTHYIILANLSLSDKWNWKSNYIKK